MHKLKYFFASIKYRLYLSFFLLVMLFVVNGVITLSVLFNNHTLSSHISNVVDPATQGLTEFDKLVIESKMLSTNWVFISSNVADKGALLKIHDERYPNIKKKINELAPKLFDRQISDSLRKVFTEFDELIVIQKGIIASLNSFDSYNESLTMMEMQLMVEDEIIPRSAKILSTLGDIIKTEQQIRQNAHNELEASSMRLRNMLLMMAILVIAIGMLVSVYLVKIITNPIHQLRGIINDMGRGNLKTIEYKNMENEIGLMVSSVNNLSATLKESANFATEIGRGNFSMDFKPIGDEDVLGKALITMRDNLKESDHRLNQAQAIAKLGSWEFDSKSQDAIWSDELYHILGYERGKIKACLGNFLEMVLEEDKVKLSKIWEKGISTGSFQLECKILTADNVLKDLYIQGQPEYDEHNKVNKYVGILQDRTIEKQAEEKLQQNNAELLKTNKELDKFVYSVSHDLRAPLSSMLGIVQLTEEDCEDEFIKENLGMVKGSILKLDGFIQDILAYSRNARLDVKKDEILFKDLLVDITGNLKHMSSSTENINITTNVNQTASFKSDKSRLNIVLSNLISNAIRYHNPSEPNPFVNINVEINDKEAQIIVADNGVGIRKDLQQKVFEMFYRVSENSQGSGLGLYIVKETIDKLNGNIQIESEPGVGTKFTISMPNT